MSIKEQIRIEIKRRREKSASFLYVKALDDILAFLNTLEAEEKDVDLEKEIWKAEEKYGDIDEMGGYHILLFDDEFRDLLRHFAQWGAEHLKKLKK